MVLHLNKLETLFTQAGFALSLVVIGPVVLEKKIFKISSIYILAIWLLSTLGSDVALKLYKFESPSPENALC